jgi:hypothetical protein
MVTRDSECDPPELFATEEEANKNACLGVVDTHVIPLFRRALAAGRSPVPAKAPKDLYQAIGNWLDANVVEFSEGGGDFSDRIDSLFRALPNPHDILSEKIRLDEINTKLSNLIAQMQKEIDALNAMPISDAAWIEEIHQQLNGYGIPRIGEHNEFLSIESRIELLAGRSPVEPPPRGKLCPYCCAEEFCNDPTHHAAGICRPDPAPPQGQTPDWVASPTPFPEPARRAEPAPMTRPVEPLK